MPEIPSEAREALMRAWIALLRERHPGVVWTPVENTDEARTEDAVDETTDSSTDGDA